MYFRSVRVFTLNTYMEFFLYKTWPGQFKELSELSHTYTSLKAGERCKTFMHTRPIT